MANVVLAPAKKAAIAVAVSILTTVYHMLRDGTCYQDLGAEHFTRRNPAKAAARVANRIRNLGYHAEIRGCRMKPRIQFLRRRRCERLSIKGRTMGILILKRVSSVAMTAWVQSVVGNSMQ